MDGFFSIITAIVGFGILVFFHELGHFIMAKIFKVKVEVFSLGWGPKLFGFKKGETTYQIAVFPIGGFCKFKGDEMTDKLENLSKDPDSFYGTKPYKRLLIAFFGPMMNYIIAVLFLAILAMGSYKEFYLPNKILLVDEIKDNASMSPAKRSGIMSGDEIIKINDKNINTYEDLTKYMVLRGNKKSLDIQVKRDGEIVKLTVNPDWDPEQLKSILGVYYFLKPIVKYNEKSTLLNYLKLQDKDEIIGIDDDYKNITDIKVNQYLDKNFSSNKSGIIHIKRGESLIDIN
ncbi:MAG TPA: site-2 protease family protein, partial [Spirochaetota bacterium]|nr:site-2 protease family protein [Spirochaetota bacterium]